MAHRNNGRRVAMVVAVVSSLVGANLALPAAPATALTTGQYVRMSRKFANVVPLRTRGYYPDDTCLYGPVPACRTPLGNYRNEATAQARAIRRLSLLRRFLNVPLSNGMSGIDGVQWEGA